MGSYFIFFIYPTYIVEESQRLSFPGDISLNSMEVTGSKQVKKPMSESGNCYKEKQKHSKQMIF